MAMQLPSDVHHEQLLMLPTQHKAFEPKDQDSDQQLVDPDTGIGVQGPAKPEPEHWRQVDAALGAIMHRQISYQRTLILSSRQEGSVVAARCS